MAKLKTIPSFDLREWFKTEGVEPIWPTHSAWSLFDQYIKLSRINPWKTPIGELLDGIQPYSIDGESKEKIYESYTLAAAPVLATYIQWATLPQKGYLHDFMWSPRQHVMAHPIVKAALNQYIKAMPSHEYAEITGAVSTLTRYGPLSTEVDGLLRHHIHAWVQKGGGEATAAIASVMGRLHTPINDLTPDQWWTIEQALPWECPLNYFIEKITAPDNRLHMVDTRLEPSLAALVSDINSPVSQKLALWYQYLPMIDGLCNDLYTYAVVLAGYELSENPALSPDEALAFKQLLQDTLATVPEPCLTACQKLGPMSGSLCTGYLARASLVRQCNNEQTLHEVFANAPISYES